MSRIGEVKLGAKHNMCIYVAIFVSLVTPHLKDDYFTKKIKLLIQNI